MASVSKWERLKREKGQFLEERGHHVREWKRLDQEVEWLQQQLQYTSDKEERRKLADTLSLTEARRELENSKCQKADAQLWQRHYELLKVQGTVRAESEIGHYKMKAEEWEDKVKKNEEVVNKLEKKREQYDDSKSHLLEAMKAGFVRVVMFLCFILGMPGVGKTNLKCLLLNQDPPQQRTSTNCAEAPVRIEIRNVTGTKVQTTGGRWHDVDNEEMFDIIANMILVADPESRIEVDLMEEEAVHSKQPKTSNTFFSRIRNWMKRNSKPKNTDSNEEGATNVPHASPQPLPSNVSDACKSAMHVIMDKLVQCIMKAKGQMTMADISRIKQNLKLTWVYFTDSGGQPEYHELLPLFVRRISSAVCVIPLPSKLDETQDVEYFKNGQRIGDIQQSQFTEKDTVRCLFNTIESYSTQEEPPKVMVVGTYLDKLMELQQESAHAAVETDLQQKIASSDMLEDKDRQLREFLECDFPIQLVYYSESSTTKKLIFPVNTLSRAEHEKAVAESIRCSIESSGAMEENVPIWWYIMELLLQKLAEELRRGVLSRAECLQMASLLNITEDAFHDALVYFDKLNVLTYSPDVLPNVVFVESQIPLDKVSELVFHSYYLRQPTPAMSEEWRHFRDRGVVTMKCLEQFPRHYVQDIFSADDFCKFLQQRLVLAPIPKPESSSSEQVQEAASTTNDQPSSSTPAKKEPHYVMPALWSTLSEVELDSRRVSSPMAATLLVRFPRGFRRAGVFCCFTVHLIRYCGWDLLLETDQQLYRNCIKLRLLGSPPVTVVLIDSNSYIEVHVNTTTGIPIAEYAHLLPCIKNSILSGIFAACRALNYKQTKPHLTFYCPHTLPSASTDNSPKSKVQHTATLSRDRKYWRCDLDPDAYFGPLENQHAIWFGLPQESQPKPKLRDLLRHLTPLASDWKTLGTFLELESLQLDRIEKDYRNQSMDCLREMISALLKQSNPEPTWQAVIEAVEPLDPQKAKKIRDKFDK